MHNGINMPVGIRKELTKIHQAIVPEEMNFGGSLMVLVIRP